MPDYFFKFETPGRQPLTHVFLNAPDELTALQRAVNFLNNNGLLPADQRWNLSIDLITSS